MARRNAFPTVVGMLFTFVRAGLFYSADYSRHGPVYAPFPRRLIHQVNFTHMSANRECTHTFMFPIVVTLVQIVREDAGVPDDNGAFSGNLVQGTIRKV